MDEKNVEQLLRDHALLKTPEAAEDAVLGLLSAGGAQSPARWPVLLAAAVILLVAGGLGFRWMQNRNGMNINVPPTVLVVSAADRAYVLLLDASKGEVVWQSLGDFEIRRSSAGSALGDKVVVDVTSTEMSLKDGSGTTSSVSVKDYNGASMRALRTELQGLGSRVEAGVLTPAEGRRLHSIALFGDEVALALLTSLAGGNSPIAEDARAWLADNRRENSLLQLIDLAANGSPKHKRMAISGLAKIQSPRAVQSLRNIVLGEDAELATHVLKEIASARRPEAAAWLQAVSESLPDGSLKAGIHDTVLRLVGQAAEVSAPAEDN